MNNWGKNEKDPAENIPCEKWVKYFDGLLNDKNAAHRRNLPIQMNVNTFDPVLDGRISITELKQGLADLKVGKAPGPDDILGGIS